jgi:hypothetical protein
MSLVYKVNVLKSITIQELPNGWKDEDFSAILELVDFDDWDEIDPRQLKDYTILLLQQMEADVAAEFVLKYKFEDRLTVGQIHNVAQQMMHQKIWEEYPDINLHRELYNCAVLLKWAFPDSFPNTDAIKCILDVECKHPESLKSVTKSFLTRLLANGMNDQTILNRLFKEQIDNTKFPETEGIIWDFQTVNDYNKTIITVYSSEYWLKDMNDVRSYNSLAFSDVHEKDKTHWGEYKVC